jgi:hypothetical protein
MFIKTGDVQITKIIDEEELTKEQKEKVKKKKESDSKSEDK